MDMEDGAKTVLKETLVSRMQSYGSLVIAHSLLANEISDGLEPR